MRHDVDWVQRTYDALKQRTISYLFNNCKTIDSTPKRRYNVDNETENVSSK